MKCATQHLLWRWAPLLIIAAGILAYCNSLSSPLIFDDLPSVVENPNIRHVWPLTVSMKTQPQMPIAARPVVSLSFAINYAISKLHPWSYHLWNIAVHVICALLLYGIIRRTIGRSGIALIVAILFVVHPLNTEVVDYSMQRTESMWAMFGLLTLYCFIRGWYVPAVIACAIGMGCKEVMAVVPLLVLVYDRIFIGKSWRRVKWPVHLALFATLGVLAYLMHGSPRSMTSSLTFKTLSPIDYLKTQAGVLVHYLQLVFWPHPLVIDYHDWPLARNFGDFWWQGLVILGLMGLTIWSLRRRPAVGFCGVVFFVALAPTSSILPLAGEFAAERRMYVPLMVILPLLVLGGEWALKRLMTPRRLLAGSTVIILLLVGGMTAVCIRRNEDYATSERIFEDVIAKRPNNARGWANYAAAILEEHPDQSERALQAGLRSLELEPSLFTTQRLVGTALSKKGEHEWALRHLHQALVIQRMLNDPDQAATMRALAMGYVRADRLPEAMYWFQRAIEMDPKHAAIRNEYGYQLARVGKFGEAMAQFNEAIALDPDMGDAYYNRALILTMRGETSAALADFRKAMELDPKRFDVLAKLAWILAVHPSPAVRNPVQAVAIAEKAAKLAEGKDAEVLDALAAAYAQSGRFDEAVKTAQQARDVAQKTGKTLLADAIGKREALYRNRHVYIQPGAAEASPSAVEAPPAATTRDLAHAR